MLIYQRVNGCQSPSQFETLAFDNLLQCSDLWLVYDHVRAMYLCLVSATPKLGPSMAASHSVTISPSSACRMRYLAVGSADASEILPLF